MVEPKIGCWWAECCIHDLFRVETPADLMALRARLSPSEVEEIGNPAGVWPSLDEALEALTPKEGEDEFGRGIAFALKRYVRAAHNTEAQ